MYSGNIPINAASRHCDAPSESADNSNWRSRLLLTQRGRPYGNIANVLVALRCAPEFAGLFGGTTRPTLLREPPFHNAAPVPRPVWYTDIGLVQEWLQRRGINASYRTVDMAVDIVAKEPRQ